MNDGIRTSEYAAPPATYGLLGRPMPVPMIDARVYDPDAMSWVRRVEIADRQPLETMVIEAVNAFVVGCKNDGTWKAIKACCILQGARTLSGALTPLVGPAPTNFNFVSGDYNRRLGLASNTNTKHLDSGRAANSDPQNNFHMAAMAFPFNSLSIMGDSTNGNFNVINQTGSITVPALSGGCRSATTVTRTLPAGLRWGFVGVSRLSQHVFSLNNASNNIEWSSLQVSVAPSSRNLLVFARNTTSGASQRMAGRVAFYSIGEGLSLRLLSTRVITLYNTLLAIP